jgi:prophage regulatory protein
MVDEPDRIISAEERRKLVPYSDVHVRRLERQGQFPKRIRLGRNGRIGWSSNEIQAWIATRMADR